MTCKLLLLGACLVAAAQAQGVPVLQRGNVEVSGFGTSNFGSTLGGLSARNSSPGMPPFSIVTPSSNGGGGVQGTYSFAARWRIYCEWSYIAGGKIDFNQVYAFAVPNSITNSQSLSATTSAWNADAGAQYLFLLHRLPKIVPYLSAGLGALGTRGGSSGSTVGGPIGTLYSFSNSVQAQTLVGSGGVGARYYFTERAGLRFEIDGFFGLSQSAGNVSVNGAASPLSSGNPHFGRAVFGFFYQLH
jgi:hypothetical protein